MKNNIARKIEIMDTTLRDGEQAEGVNFDSRQKLAIAKMLLTEVKVDRVEVASARVSKGEQKSVKKIMFWAKDSKFSDKIEVLGFVDRNISADWIASCGGKVMNLLCKGSEKHCVKQLGKTPAEHFSDITETFGYARKHGLKLNAYLEDWSQGIRDGKNYVIELTRLLCKLEVERVMLPDTLGVLTPDETGRYIKEMVNEFPDARFDFHGHNDYGLATANALAAVNAGAMGIHTTVNSLGERTGNGSLSEAVAVINDKTQFKCGADEKKLVKIANLVSNFSGRKIPENEPIIGGSVFTQVAGIHADGDMKAGLYETELSPERFGGLRKYALGKLSGRASLEINLRKMGIVLARHQKEKLLQKIVEMGDQGKKVSAEDLPMIIKGLK